MPSRGTNGNPNRPRRAKSNSSIKSRQNMSVDPEIIDQHALTAAALAFERANGRAMAMRMSPGREVAATSSDNGPLLARKQSVRFVGPMAMPTRQRSITRREALDYKSNVGQSQNGASEEEYFGSEVASMPSSYKRIRKSKSMYSPRTAPSFQSTHGTPRTGFRSRSQSEQSSDGAIRLSQLPRPSLRRSFSFLRGKSDQLSCNAHQNTSTDAAVQMARDQYLRQIEQQRLKKQPPILTLGKRHKPQKTFRRTVRSSSTNSYGSAVASAAPVPTEPNIARGLGDRARSISFSFKKKLKRVFHRPSDAQEVMPAQQLNARRPHFGDYKATSSGLEQRYEGIPSPDGDTLRRACSRESSLRNSPVILDKGSPAGSIRSARSEDSSSNSKSRVTSWTNSTAANTLSSRQKRERKRLSVIQENGGPYQPSSSVRDYGELGDVFTALRKPVRNNSVAGHKRGLVDSQRIYSALQRRLGDKGRQAVDEEEPSTANPSGQARSHLSDNTPRRSSINSRPDTSNSLETKDAKYSSDSPRGIKLSKSFLFEPLTSGNVDDVFSSKQDISPQEDSDTHMDLTSHHIAKSNEVNYPTTKRPLREVKSGFFPSNMRLERSNTSPFRRAMHPSRSEANTEEGFQPPELPILQPHRTIYGFSNGSVTGSESVYSRTSGGNTPKPTESSFSLVKSETSGEAGTAFIVSSQSEKRHESRRPFAQRDLCAAKSSGDWQNWMVSQVTNLESRDMETTKIYDACRLKEIGHRRENAQLDDEDLALGKLPRSINAPKQPLAIVHSNLVNRPTLEHRTSYSMIDRFPLLDIAPESNVSYPKQEKTAPNDLNDAQARPLSNVENERYSSGLNRPYAMSGHLRNKVSSTTLRSQRNGSTTQRYQTKGYITDSPNSQGTLTPPSVPGNGRTKTKPKTPSRHSPERLARLRRMRSSDPPGFPSPGEPPSYSAKAQNQVYNGDIEGPLLGDPHSKGLDSGDDRSTLITNDTTIPGGQKMVNLFLSKRRRNMKSSEDSGGDPAFL